MAGPEGRPAVGSLLRDRLKRSDSQAHIRVREGVPGESTCVGNVGGRAQQAISQSARCRSGAISRAVNTESWNAAFSAWPRRERWSGCHGSCRRGHPST